MHLSIIVPCYNESENISKLKAEFLPVIETLISMEIGRNQQYQDLEVIFVDDGSQDDTFQRLINEFRAPVDHFLNYKFERHPSNRGLGAALRTGFAAATGDILITIDSDGTYQYSEIADILRMLTTGVDIITASPYHPKGHVDGVPAYRLLLSKGSSLIYRILLNWRIHTYTSLFRVYRSDVIRRTKFESDGFLAGTELLVKAMLLGYRVVEYPTVLHKRMHGLSKAKIARTIASHLHFQWRLMLHRFHLASLIALEQNIHPDIINI